MGAWDGQHTSLALYLIATQALGMAFEDVEVPVNIYDIVSRIIASTSTREKFIRRTLIEQMYTIK